VRRCKHYCYSLDRLWKNYSSNTAVGLCGYRRCSRVCVVALITFCPTPFNQPLPARYNCCMMTDRTTTTVFHSIFSGFHFRAWFPLVFRCSSSPCRRECKKTITDLIQTYPPNKFPMIFHPFSPFAGTIKSIRILISDDVTAVQCNLLQQYIDIRCDRVKCVHMTY